jgi:hypothetical protein
LDTVVTFWTVVGSISQPTPKPLRAGGSAGLDRQSVLR